MDFCLLLKIYAKILKKQETSKNVSSKSNQKLLDHAKQSASDALKTVSKKAVQKQLAILVVIQLPTRLQKPQKIQQEILQRQLKVKKNYAEKDIYFQ